MDLDSLIQKIGMDPASFGYPQPDLQADPTLHDPALLPNDHDVNGADFDLSAFIDHPYSEQLPDTLPLPDSKPQDGTLAPSISAPSPPSPPSGPTTNGERNAGGANLPSTAASILATPPTQKKRKSSAASESRKEGTHKRRR